MRRRSRRYMALDGGPMAVSMRLPANGQAVEAGTPTTLFRARPVAEKVFLTEAVG